MPTTTYTPLATATLTGTDSEVKFQSIPATYRDLILVISASSNNDGSIIRYTLNNDTTAVYSSVLMIGVGSGTGISQSESGATSVTTAGIGVSTTNGKYMVRSQIMDYSATDKHKTILTRTDEAIDTYPGTAATASRWAKTEAVHTISIYVPTASFTSGSTFSLYGVIA